MLRKLLRRRLKPPLTASQPIGRGCPSVVQRYGSIALPFFVRFSAFA
jgi:hypothetical protein